MAAKVEVLFIFICLLYGYYSTENQKINLFINKFKLKNLNKTYLFFLFLGIVVAFGSFILSFFTSFYSENWIDFGLNISYLSGLLLLLMNGTFIKTKYYNYSFLFISMLFIGSLFKVNHWPLSNLLITTAYIGIVILYSISFFKKPIKKRLDILKLIWVLLEFCCNLLIFFHIIINEYSTIPMVLLFLMVFEFLRIEKQNGKLFRL